MSFDQARTAADIRQLYTKVSGEINRIQGEAEWNDNPTALGSSQMVEKRQTCAFVTRPVDFRTRTGGEGAQESGENARQLGRGNRTFDVPLEIAEFRPSFLAGRPLGFLPSSRSRRDRRTKRPRRILSEGRPGLPLRRESLSPPFAPQAWIPSPSSFNATRLTRAKERDSAPSLREGGP